jgi:hypothetical protein
MLWAIGKYVEKNPDLFGPSGQTITRLTAKMDAAVKGYAAWKQKLIEESRRGQQSEKN